MLLGIVSDTHGHVNNTLQAVRMLQSLEVEQVLHCGDIGSTAIVELFSDWPTHFVFGNVDYNEAELHQAIEEAGQTCHGRFGSLELCGVKIAVLHSDDGRRFRQTVKSGDWDLVCYGHTHEAEHHLEEKTLVLNPGAIYRANPYSVAVVSLPTMEITQVPF